MYQFKFQDAGMGGSRPGREPSEGMGGSLLGLLNNGAAGTGLGGNAGGPTDRSHDFYVAGEGGGMDVMGTAKLHSDFGTQFASNPGWNGKGYGD